MKDDIKPPAKPDGNKSTAGPKPQPTSVDSSESILIDEDGQPEESRQPAVSEAVPAATLTGTGNFITKPFIKLAQRFSGLSRKWQAAVVVGALVVLVGIGFGLHSLLSPKVAPALKVTKDTPKSDLVASPLSGVQVTKQAASRPVTGIMIENSLDARPQSGLQDAGVVYEAVAEAGITRFLALFQDTAPQYIGPVRSLRPYYIDYAAPFQASIVHVGGSPDALSEVQNGSFRNLDQFYNGNSFTRVNSRDAPHNVYTSFDQLDSLNQSRGYTTSSFTSWARKKDAKLATPSAKTINLSISSTDYNVHYDYDAASNSYARSEGGTTHMNLVSSGDTVGVQLKPKVVIALVVPLSNGALDASNAYYSNYTTSGSGTAYIFQDGGVTQATWAKDSTQGQLLFKDSAGKTFKLNAGQTWVTLLGSSGNVTYAP